MKVDISKVKMRHKIEHEFTIFNGVIHAKAIVEFDNMNDVYIQVSIDRALPIEVTMNMLTKSVQAAIREKMLEVLDEENGYDPIQAKEDLEAEMADRANDDWGRHE